MGSRITVERLRKFRKIAGERAELPGDIPGFFYIKLARGGAWRLRYTDPVTSKGKPKRLTATIAGDDVKPDQAAKIAAEWRAKIAKGINPRLEQEQEAEKVRRSIEAQKKSKFANTGTFFEEIYRPHLSRLTRAGESNLSIIKSNFSHLFDRDMDSLQAADIRAWENKRKAEGIRRDTLQRALVSFKAMINYAAGTKKGDPIDAPVIEANPLAGVMLARETEAERELEESAREEKHSQRDLLSQTDLANLQTGLNRFADEIRAQRRRTRYHGKPELPDLDTVPFPHWFIPFCHIARLTGMRPGDILRLKWSSIRQDFRNKCEALVFKPHKTQHHAKAIEVVFPITAELSHILRAWQQQNGNPETGLLFPSRKNGELMDKSAYHRHWTNVKKLAGLRDDMHFYSFRHTFISDRVNAGWPLLQIAKLVGHKTTDMIAQNYYREDLDNLAGLLAALEASNKRGTG